MSKDCSYELCSHLEFIENTSLLTSAFWHMSSLSTWRPVAAFLMAFFFLMDFWTRLKQSPLFSLTDKQRQSGAFSLTAGLSSPAMTSCSYSYRTSSAN